MSDSFGALGVIPARAASTRFPLKVLAKIKGKPLIQHVWERVVAAGCFDEVLVAVDHPDVAGVVKSFGGKAEMTPPDFESGSDRVNFVAQRYQYPVVVNIQGDEPIVSPEAIFSLVKQHAANPKFAISTLAVWKENDADVNNPNVVKLVKSKSNRALYFSRATLLTEPNGYWKHIGIYAYSRESLQHFCQLTKSPLEATERLEQLRALENNMDIQVVVSNHDTISVDRPEDVLRVEEYLDRHRP